MRLEFVKSAQFVDQFPHPDRPEVALVGRSNSGKSSFLNALTQKSVAKVSSRPGKTKLLNFFNVGQNYRIVDMPGYGFAAVNNKEVSSWKTMIEDYLTHRENLVGLILIMDARRKWQEEEELILNWSQEYDCPMIVCLNKVDRMKKNEVRNNIKKIKESLPYCQFFNTSTKGPPGVFSVEDYIYNEWVKPGVST